MLEFLQPLVDLIAKTVPALSKRRERDEAAKLGAELFLLYVQCNEALVQGEHIVRSLENYLTLVAQGSQWSDDVRTSLSRILRDRLRTVRRPREQLERIRSALEKIRPALVANFSLGDVLLRAGDPRASRR
ncbi:hypothetical protein [Kutzneria sp. NPDC051319]|uniref:hypothetical protein n=1 Tax=Kutzneria sp. NPDC051319 TaxID=3155047 RepID=UPI0034332D4B